MILHASIRQIRQAYLLIFIQPILRAVSQICFKLASSSPSVESALTIFVQPTIWIGIAIQIISFPLLLQIHRILPLSRVAPLISVGLIWTALLGVFLLSEPLDLYRITGIALILLGAIVISTDSQKGTAHVS